MRVDDRLPGAKWGWRTALDVTATGAMLVAAAVVIWATLVKPARSANASTKPATPIPAEPVSLEGAPILGAAAAKVAIIEFSDFECPYCARFFQDALPELRAKYIDTGKVRLAFRHLPLPMHQRARAAAEAAECARRQSRFWEFHDQFFTNPGKLQEADIAAIVQKVKLDAAMFGACAAGEASEQIRRDEAMAKALELSGTPAFLLGLVQPDGRVKVLSIVTGARPASEFSAALETMVPAVGGG